MNTSTQVLAVALSAASLATDPSGAASPGGFTERGTTIEETYECRSSAATPLDTAPPLSSAQIEMLVLGMAQNGHARTATDAWAGLRVFADTITRKRVETALSAHQPMYLKWQLFLDALPDNDARITADTIDAIRAV